MALILALTRIGELASACAPAERGITHRTYLHYMKTASDLSGVARINARAAAKNLQMGVQE